MRSGSLKDDAPKDLDNWWVKLNEARAKTSSGEWMRNIGNSYMTEADAQLIADAPLLLQEVRRIRAIAEDLWVYIHSNADIDLNITARQMDWFICPVCLLGTIDEGECDNGGNPCTEGDD
jgi:hypothetical protein